MILCALIATLAGAVLAYAGHPRQGLLKTARPALCGGLAAVCVAVGAFAWVREFGVGSGIAGLSVNLMLAWVALPYVAWWRRYGHAAERTR
ncbi:MAG TPA: hypothetical protein VME63_08420 [Dyella sp.]|uniref:hypothetical protein n=1 Tax=Dyella sp. TaxID=1869338 RepID=UPI002B52144C|nr:hypothetical protein [Dyella sp.]HTV85416.1 hypothetical protein [Dyella sp.]